MNITIEMQIACARRELALRQRVYPRWVAAKKMKQAEADKEIAAMAAMAAIEATLHAVRDGTMLPLAPADSGSTERTNAMPDDQPIPFEEKIAKSSQVCFVDYDWNARELSVVFRTNPVRYVYLDYPPEQWDELRAAPSIGSFLFHNVTRPRNGILPYRFEKRALPDGFVMPALPERRMDVV